MEIFVHFARKLVRVYLQRQCRQEFRCSNFWTSDNDGRASDRIAKMGAAPMRRN